MGLPRGGQIGNERSTTEMCRLRLGPLPNIPTDCMGAVEQYVEGGAIRERTRPFTISSDPPSPSVIDRPRQRGEIRNELPCSTGKCDSVSRGRQRQRPRGWHLRRNDKARKARQHRAKIIHGGKGTTRRRLTGGYRCCPLFVVVGCW